MAGDISAEDLKLLTDPDIKKAVQALEGAMLNMGVNPGALDGKIDEAFVKGVEGLTDKLLGMMELSKSQYTPALGAKLVSVAAEKTDSVLFKSDQLVALKIADNPDVPDTLKKNIPLLRQLVAAMPDLIKSADLLYNKGLLDAGRVQALRQAALEQAQAASQTAKPAAPASAQQAPAPAEQAPVQDTASQAEEVSEETGGQPVVAASDNTAPDAPSNQSAEAQPSPDQSQAPPPPPSLGDATLTVEAGLQMLSAKFGLPAPGMINGEFDDVSQASAWALISHMKSSLGIEPADGKFNPQTAPQIITAMANNENYRKAYADVLGGDQQLLDFFVAMDVLAQPQHNKLLSQPPQPKDEKDVSMILLGKLLSMIPPDIINFINSIFMQIFGVNLSEGLGFLNEIGLDVPKEVVEKVDSVVGQTSATQMSSDDVHNDLHKTYKDAWTVFEGDTDKLKNRIMIPVGIMNYFGLGNDTETEREAKEKALEAALDKAAETADIDVNGRADIFAKTFQAELARLKAVAPAQTAPAATTTPPAPTPMSVPAPAATENPEPSQPEPVDQGDQGEQGEDHSAAPAGDGEARIGKIALSGEFAPQAEMTIFNPANAPDLRTGFYTANYGVTKGLFMMDVADATFKPDNIDEPLKSDVALERDPERSLTA